MTVMSRLQTLDQVSPYFTVEAVIAGTALETHVIENADFPVRVCDCHYVMTQAGGGACTGTLDNGANGITDAMDVNAGDRDIVRAVEINDLYADIAAGGDLDFTLSAATGVTAGRVYVLCQMLAP